MSPMFQVTEMSLETLVEHLNESLCRIGFQASAPEKRLALAAFVSVRSKRRLPRSAGLPARFWPMAPETVFAHALRLLRNVSGTRFRERPATACEGCREEKTPL